MGRAVFFSVPDCYCVDCGGDFPSRHRCPLDFAGHESSAQFGFVADFEDHVFQHLDLGIDLSERSIFFSVADRYGRALHSAISSGRPRYGSN